MRGLKLHPPLQQFFPNDRLAYPLYEVFAEARLPVLFHTGHSGIGTGMRGGGGMRLKYGHPMPIDDVAVDFPDMPIIMAHPSFPWQDEAISICLHKPQVYIDLSGWSPKYFSPTLMQYANTLLKRKVLFGSDYPLLTPDRWLADFEKIAHQGRGAAADPEGERGTPARPGAGLGPHALGSAEVVRQADVVLGEAARAPASERPTYSRCACCSRPKKPSLPGSRCSIVLIHDEKSCTRQTRCRQTAE